MQPAACCPATVTRTHRPAWAAVAFALLLVLAQTLLLQHQSEHPIDGAHADCAVCVSGNALDHAAGVAASPSTVAGEPGVAAPPPAVPTPTTAPIRPTARGPPHRL